jgi:hypothetical protein
VSKKIIKVGETYQYHYPNNDINGPHVGTFTILGKIVMGASGVFVGRFKGTDGYESYYLFNEDGKVVNAPAPTPSSVGWCLDLGQEHEVRVVYPSGDVSAEWYEITTHYRHQPKDRQYLVREKGKHSTVKLMNGEDFNAFVTKLFP